MSENKEENKNIKDDNNKENEEQKENSNENKKKFNPYIPDPENPFNNLNHSVGEFIPQSELTDEDYTLICYNCKNPIIVRDGWEIFECANCRKLNKLPRKLINELYFEKKLKNVYYNDYINHLDTIVPTTFILVDCPFCRGTNKVRKRVDHCKCYFCEKSFNVDKTEELVKPIEQVSLNPNSKFYRFKGSENEVKRVYPPNLVYRTPEFWFPEPLDYSNNLYYNPYNINKIYYNDFKWDKNTHQLTFIDPYTNRYDTIASAENTENINNYINNRKYELNNNKLNKNVGSNNNNNMNNNDNKKDIDKYANISIEDLKYRIEKKKEEKTKLYNSLFFMK